MNYTDHKAGSRVLDMSNSDYHGAAGLSSSQLKYFYTHSPSHFYYRHICGGATAEKTTPALLLGTLVHCLVLEPDAFDKRYQKMVSIDDCPDALRTVADLREYCKNNGLRTDGLKQELVDRVVDHAPSVPVFDDLLRKQDRDEREIIDGVLWDKAHHMYESVKCHEEIKRLFTDGAAEVSMWGCDRQTGMLTKCRCDWFRYDGVVVDLKTCASAAPGSFSTACAKYDYALQQVHYTAVIESMGYEKPEFVFVAVENEPPYICACYALDDRSIRAAEVAYRAILDRLHTCRHSGEWPAYTSKLKSLSLPGWKIEQLEQTGAHHHD